MSLNNEEVIKLIVDEAVRKPFEWFQGEPLDFSRLSAERCYDLVDNDLDIFFQGKYDVTKYSDFLKENRDAIVKSTVEQLKMLWS